MRSQLDRTLWHDEVTDTYVGSNHQIVTRADSRARELSHGAVRVVTLQDTEHPTLKQMIYQRNYVDVPEAIIQTQEGEFAKQIAEIVAQRNIPLSLPCKVTGLDLTVDGKYIVRPDFALTQHPSLNFENNRKRFSRMENGFPVFEDNGEYTWYLRNDSSAWVCRSGSLDAVGDDADFDNSNTNGLVVLTADAVGAPEIFESFVRKLKEERETQLVLFAERYETARQLLLGKK